MNPNRKEDRLIGHVLDQEAIRNHLAQALDARTPLAVWTALADIPLLLAEIDRLGMHATDARLLYANLLAAVRATLAAYAEGEPDHLSYLRDEITPR